MGKRGPRHIPTALKKAHGTYRADRAVPNEMQLDPETPQMPKWLDEEAKAEWKRVVPQLNKLGLLSVVDRSMLADYCTAHSVAMNATLEYQRDGLMVPVHGQLNYFKKHPMIKVAQEARQQARQLASEFGLSPASRSRVSVPVKKDSTDADESFLFNKPKLVKP